MSQYGAHGAAKQGLTYRQIIDFYYPGTTWSTVTGGVRVLITADTTSDVVVIRPATGLPVRDLGQRPHLPAARCPRRHPLAAHVDGGQQDASWTTSPARWHRWRPGGRASLVGDGQFARRRR